MRFYRNVADGQTDRRTGGQTDQKTNTDWTDRQTDRQGDQKTNKDENMIFAGGNNPIVRGISQKYRSRRTGFRVLNTLFCHFVCYLEVTCDKMGLSKLLLRNIDTYIFHAVNMFNVVIIMTDADN